ncbi:MAG: alpha/beta hydrolase [Acidobacteria bacterium]|nr:MAG: alpha/beta hydrolase [Acidobacteriota bacterium]
MLLMMGAMAQVYSSDVASPREEAVEFKNGEVQLAGTLVLPPTEGPHPAVVFVHGSGPATRSQALALARLFAAEGIAGLAYDKRGSGDSTGNWVTSSLEDLAEDAIAGLELLKKQPQIDAERVGLWGHSQGCWVGTLATELSKKIDFLIMVSGGGATPHEAEMHSYRQSFVRAGLSDSEQLEATQLLDRYFRFLGTGKDRKALEDAIETSRSKKWFELVPIERILPSEKNQPNWQWVATFDPVPYIQKMQLPVLVLFGAEDHANPVSLSAKKWQEGLLAAGNQHHSVQVLQGANHDLRTGGHGGPFADGYLTMMFSWVHQKTSKPPAC